MGDPRVPLLRERLNLAAEPNSEYNAELAKAVGKFQQTNGILASGQLNAPTVEALNGPSPQQADRGRARHHGALALDAARSPAFIHVVLNVPDYQLRVYDNGKPIWQTRTVVGTPGHATPLLTETMKSITVNPTWNVPQSIIY